MSAGMVTVNAGFRALKTHAPLLFWPVVVVYTTLGGLGHGLAMHYLDTRLIACVYLLLVAALMWPVFVDVGLGRASGTLAALLLTALFWWTSWIGWHVAEGARPQGPFTGMAFVSDHWTGPSPYDFDADKGAAAGMAFARLPAADWPDYFTRLSETKKIERPLRRRRRARRQGEARYLSPEALRQYWVAEPILIWGTLLIVVWPRRAEQLLAFTKMIPRRRGLRLWR
ncbi:MAG: hypothetical protein AAF675_10055 [Pseudomonadota bacterium]